MTTGRVRLAGAARISHRLILLLAGLTLLIGGIRLVALGGSVFFLLAGLLYSAAAGLGVSRRGPWLVHAVLVLTVAWCISEQATTFWSLFSRFTVPLLLSALAGLFSISERRRFGAVSASVGGLSALALAAVLLGAFLPHGEIHPLQARAATDVSNTAVDTGGDWSAYGRSAAGTRFAPLTQINRSNVSRLHVAWIYHTGDKGTAPGADENTPLAVDGTVYTCSRNNHVAALDADTGQQRWTFDPQVKSPFWQVCRGVSYYKTPAPSATAPSAQCAARIVLTTGDARMFELDATTGKPCEDFGEGGVVHLNGSMGEVKPGFYFQTSAPLVAHGLIVVGGWVVDNQEIGEPSGVVRAFDVRSGALVWAWDLGNPGITKLPPPGQTYTRATPNMWTTASYDDRLGMVYLPLGNTTPDYIGIGRPASSERYNSTLVAVDIATGRERWRFQTVHHDLWDYDLPSQPALVDLPDGHGGTVPALLQTTKRGQLFLLNRETGLPLSKVVEKAVPGTSEVSGEKVSPTQPYSVEMPTIGAAHLTEKKAWGLTLFDALQCRIQFRTFVYRGDFTPIGLHVSIQQPGNLGGMNWGSVSVDTNRHIAYMNDLRIPTKFWLIPRVRYAEEIKKISSDGSGHGPAPQIGMPYGMATALWTSSLGIPCSEPPFGTVTAVNLVTKKVEWQVPGGTTEKLGPLGIASHLPLPIGMPTYAGTSVTAGGLLFFAGTQDYYLRAYDAASGKELARIPIPIGASATPMTYVSPRTGRQYVVLSVGGAAHSKDVGDYVIAFSL